VKILKAAGVALAITVLAALLAHLAPAEIPSTPAADPATVASLVGIGVMCVGADAAGTWDRCAWRQLDGTWRVADYPDGPDHPRWSCRTDDGHPCPHRPHLHPR
jgi:hypothetical protein